MPFDSELAGVYEGFIRPAALAAGFDVVRADDLHTSQNILRDIVGSISNADLVIADLTNNNPNVFYELGIAHALNKPVILLAQDIADVPFDLRAYRVLHYDTHFSRIQTARDKLTALADLASKNKLQSGNPVSDFRLVSGESQETNTNELNPQNITANEVNGNLDDLGILDYQASIEEGFNGATGCAQLFTDAFTTVTDAANSASPLLSSESGLAGNEKRQVARQMAGQIDLATQLFTTTNEKYSICIEKIAVGMNGLLSGSHGLTNEATSGMDAFLKVLQTLRDANAAQLNTTRILLSTMDSTPLIESNLTKSIKSLRQQLGIYIQNAELMSAVITHSIDLGTTLAAKAKSV